MGLRRSLGKVLGTIGLGMSARDKLLEYLPNNAVCAEIGVWKGRFSQQIYRQSTPRKLHLIDPWAFQPSFGERMYGGRVAKNQDDMDAIYADVCTQFAGRDNVTISRNYSADAAGKFDDAYFDWVYIDGNHHYDYVLADLNDFFPKVKKHGYIAGDDYLWSPRETAGDLQVKRAVEDFVQQMAGKVEIAEVYADQFVLKKLV